MKNLRAQKSSFLNKTKVRFHIFDNVAYLPRSRSPLFIIIETVITIKNRSMSLIKFYYVISLNNKGG